VNKFSDRLRRIRKERGLSQAALARASGLSQGAISSYETGTRKTTTGIIELAHALDVSPVWLLTGEGPMQSHADVASASDKSESRLRDVQAQPASAAWPFRHINPADYWALPENRRRIVEQTIAALISAMHDEK